LLKLASPSPRDEDALSCGAHLTIGRRRQRGGRAAQRAQMMKRRGSKGRRVVLHLNNCGAAICACYPDNEDNQVDDAVLGRTYPTNPRLPRPPARQLGFVNGMEGVHAGKLQYLKIPKMPRLAVGYETMSCCGSGCRSLMKSPFDELGALNTILRRAPVGDTRLRKSCSVGACNRFNMGRGMRMKRRVSGGFPEMARSLQQRTPVEVARTGGPVSDSEKKLDRYHRF
jgi:hypothetical protein